MSKYGNNPRPLHQIPYTARDIAIVYAIFAKRYMSTSQIWALFFAHTKPYKVCQERLRKLSAHKILRYVEQAFTRGMSRPCYLWTLDTVGKELLIQEKGVDPALLVGSPLAHEESNMMIKHWLSTTDVQIAVQRACQEMGITVETWLDERELRSELSKVTITLMGPNAKEIKTSLIPDAQFTLYNKGKRGIYHLELDRTTVDIEPSIFEKRSITKKIRTYLAFEQTEYYRQTYDIRPLRVLTVAVGKRRMFNMLTATEKVLKQMVEFGDGLTDKEKQAKVSEYDRLRSRFLFTTLDQVMTTNVLISPIWSVVGRNTPCSLLE